MPIEQAFNSSVEYYDDWMRKALPNYGDIFSTAAGLITFDATAKINVLDLGAGTGLFSGHVAEKYPQANFTLYDVADKMLGVAKKRFAGKSPRFKYVLDDYRRIQGENEYDLVISSLSIHHLEDEEKKGLFVRIHELLREPGLFINIDQIRGETARIRETYWNHWLEQVRRAGFPEERIRESIGRRLAYDKDASLHDQLDWLKASGFQDVDCVYKNFFVGVFVACKQSFKAIPFPPGPECG
jgi:tRNA (cmo5U34)-methyltransferase